MANMIYGCMNPKAKTTMMPVAAAQYFQHTGHSAVYVDGSGNLIASLSDTSSLPLFGHAIIPKGRGDSTNTSDSYWLSNAAAAVDYIPVIKADNGGEDFLFVSNGTPTIGQVGDDCDLVNVNTASAKTVNIGATTNDDFIIQGRGVDRHTRATTADVIVQFNIEEMQADT